MKYAPCLTPRAPSRTVLLRVIALLVWIAVDVQVVRWVFA